MLTSTGRPSPRSAARLGSTVPAPLPAPPRQRGGPGCAVLRCRRGDRRDCSRAKQNQIRAAWSRAFKAPSQLVTARANNDWARDNQGENQRHSGMTMRRLSLRRLRPQHARHLHAGPVEPLNQRRQLRRRQPHHPIHDRRPLEGALFGPLAHQHQSGPVHSRSFTRSASQTTFSIPIAICRRSISVASAAW